EPIELGLDDTGVSAVHDLLVQGVSLGTTGDIDKRRNPVERRKQLVEDGARLDHAFPADDGGRTETTFPPLALLTSVKRYAAVWERKRLGTRLRGAHTD